MGYVRTARTLAPTARRLLAGATALTLVAGVSALGGLSAAPAHAAEVSFSDSELTACVNARIGADRPADSPITQAEIDKVTNLGCDKRFTVTSLAGLESAQELRSVSLTGGTHDLSGTGSLDALAELPKLTTILISDANITDDSFSSIAGADKLTSLTVTGNPQLSDLSPVSGLTKLTKLDITKNPSITDLSPLSGLEKLADFYAGRLTDLEDLSPLEGLTALRSVNVQYSKVRDLSPLAGLTNISSFTASYTLVDSLEPLSALTKMMNLDVSYAKLTSLDGIEDMRGLRTLDIHNNTGIGDNIGALADKPELYRVFMNAIGATKIGPLEHLSALTSLQALGNEISSLVGLPNAPAAAAQGSFAVTQQQIMLPEPQYVPKGAKTFRYDVTGDAANRDGSFPAFGGNLAPVEQDDFPIVGITVRSAWPELEYSFADDRGTNDRFSGTVKSPIVWSTIDSEDSQTVPLGTTWTQQTTFTEGFPATSFALAPSSDTPVPEWVSIDETTGVLTAAPATADAIGDWPFMLLVSDALGNTMKQYFSVTVPEVKSTVFEIGEDQEAEAPGTLTFEVTRTDAGVDGYVGSASVSYRTVDGSAEAGTHYGAQNGTLTWDAGDTSTRRVTVDLLAGNAGDPDRSLMLELHTPIPEGVTELGGGFQSDGTITYPAPEPTVFALDGDHAAEAGTPITFTVTRTDADVNPWTGEASVHVITQDDTAVAGTHYVPVDETITWAAGENAPREITVETLAGDAGDMDRTFRLELFDPSTHTELGVPETGIGTITSPTPEPTVFAIDGDETAEADAPIVFTVSRTDADVNPWTGEASVDVFTRDGSAVADEHYVPVERTLTWEAKDSAPKTVEVATIPGRAGDPDRAFTLELTAPSTHTELSADPSATGTITYVTPEPTVFALDGDRDAKAGKPITFTVSRANAAVNPWTGEASVHVATEDGTAVAGEHYLAVSETLTWAADDDDDQEVTVTTLEGKAGDPKRSFTVVLSEPSEHTVLDAARSATGTIGYPDAETPVTPGDTDGDGDTGTGGTDGTGTGTGGAKHPGDIATTGAETGWLLAAAAAALAALIAGGWVTVARMRREA